MSRVKKGFTLVELLVVIGIIALLISILLPSLSKARDQAMTVQCASNLRQLYNGTVLYSNLYNGYCLPDRASSGSSWQNYWCGSYTLGAALGFKQSTLGDSTQQETDTMTHIAKFLWCPASTREKNASSVFSVDYTYNQNLGDSRAYQWDQANSGLGYPNEYTPAHQFKKWTQVPPNVIVACDAAAIITNDDQHFDTMTELTYKKQRAGAPHANHTKANVLFQDGVVRLLRAFDVPKGVASYNGLAYNDLSGTLKNADPQSYTDFSDPSTSDKLAEWMVMSPGHLDPTSVNKTTDANSVWQKNRPIPFH